MKKNNAYATNKGGKIQAPKKQQGEPKAVKTQGDDLRVRKQK